MPSHWVWSNSSSREVPLTSSGLQAGVVDEHSVRDLTDAAPPSQLSTTAKRTLPDGGARCDELWNLLDGPAIAAIRNPHSTRDIRPDRSVAPLPGAASHKANPFKPAQLCCPSLIASSRESDFLGRPDVRTKNSPASPIATIGPRKTSAQYMFRVFSFRSCRISSLGSTPRLTLPAGCVRPARSDARALSGDLTCSRGSSLRAEKVVPRHHRTKSTKI